MSVSRYPRPFDRWNTDHMQKLAAIVNCLTEDELANLSPHAALTMLKSMRDQPRGRDSDAALKRLATHLLRDIPRLGDGVPLLH